MLKLGPYEIHRIEELVFPYAGYADLIPDMPVELMEEHREILTPQQFQADKGLIVLSFHSWLIRTPHHWILVDTCIGQPQDLRTQGTGGIQPTGHRVSRPATGRRTQARGHRLRVLHPLALRSLRLEHLAGGRSLAAHFPQRALPVPQQGTGALGRPERRREEIGPHLGVYQSNIEPLIEGGLLEGVEDGYELEDGVRLRLAAGHTPGHTVLELGKDGSHGLFSGDLLHAVMQVYGPQYTTVFLRRRRSGSRNPQANAGTNRRPLNIAVPRPLRASALRPR